MVMSKGAVAVVLDVSEFRAAVKLVINNNIIKPPRVKTNNVVFEQVRHKPACTATEAG